VIDTSALMLSIQKQHVDRIFTGEKRFELRKQLPSESFSRVYLYESGGVGIVGYFDVVRTLRLPIEELWRAVGEQGTTRERFERYFAGRSQGWAIEIGHHHRWPRAISRSDLQQTVPTFAPPQSYLILRAKTPLLDVLEKHVETRAAGLKLSERRAEVGPRSVRGISLRGIRSQEHLAYSSFVQDEISRYYDEIDESFAQSNLDTATQGHDPFALLTARKEVLAVERVDGALLGFSTLTFKIGGSVKSGPTILLPEHRGRGYGTQIRILLEERASSQGARKIYATAPDISDRVLNYLLKSGMLVEAHLRAQYSARHGELILGRILQPTVPTRISGHSHDSRAGQVMDSAAMGPRQLAAAAALALASYGLKLSQEHARQLARNMGLSGAGYAQKPRDVVALKSSESIAAAIVLSSKRGGSMRGVLGTRTSHTPSLLRLLTAAEEIAVAANRRKLYFLLSSNTPPGISAFRDRGYLVEGFLREPYIPGDDLLVVSRFFP
jgi:predicted transcriptional regulator/RimJ/RimL family protein N-acetyltransferase